MTSRQEKNSTILETHALTKNFGGLRAVNQVNLKVKRGELMSIIGPNGAGKTSLFNLLSGHLSPTSGHISFNGQDITTLPSFKCCRLGIGRSFQLTNIFPELTAFQNVRVAAQARKTTFSIWRRWKSLTDVNEKSFRILERVGLFKKRNQLASKLAYGEQRYLEIGITLATDPLLLLLDEPTSGMSPEESVKTGEFIKELSNDVEIIIVEHDMEVVMNISDKVTCMDGGSVIACDVPEKIRENPEVQECYLRD